MRFLAGALLALFFTVPGAAAYEGGGSSATSIGPRIVFYRPDDADHGDWAPGAQLRLHLTSLYALEGSMDFAHYMSGTTSVRTTPIQATLIGYFTSGSGIGPYLLLGGGWYPTHADGPYSPPRLFGPHVGAGLELPLSSNLSLDGSYRFLWTEIISWSDPVHLFGQDFAVRGHMFTVALNYRL